MLPSNDPLISSTAGQYEGSFRLRRLQESPFDTLQRLHDELGHRLPTSLAEARAAAMLDGRMRRAGLQVMADTFSTTRPPGWAGIVLGLIACCALVAFYWLPWVTLGCVVLLIMFAGLTTLRPHSLAGKLRPSQNVVGTQAATEQPVYRLVLLSRLDTPWQHPTLVRLLGGQFMPMLRLIAVILVGLLTLTGIFNPQRIWLYLLALPCLYIIACGILEALALRPFWQARPSDSAGLAVLLAACEAIGTLEYTEVWAVGLGATSVAAGLQDLLQRYPFDPETTLFVALEALGNSSPAIIESEGWPNRMPADAQLLAAAQLLAEKPESQAMLIRTHLATLAQSLSTAHRRVLSIACLGQQPATHTELNPAHLEQAHQLVIGLAHAIDQWKQPA